MNDDWLETQQTTRHVHNRVNKGTKRHGGGKSGHGSFDIKYTLGTYELNCPAVKKLCEARQVDSDADGSKVSESVMEVYTLNESGNAVLGEMVFGGLWRVGMVLTGSRKVMSKVIREMEAANEEEGDEDEDEEEKEEEGEEESGARARAGKDTIAEEGKSGDADNGDEDDDGDVEEEDDEEDDENDEEAKENRRFREFEKNSFRVPKFWMKWQGTIPSHTKDSNSSASEEIITGTGYLVFASNNCNKYQGTLSCEALDWDNVKVTGWKRRAHVPRNFAPTWRAE